MRDNFTNKVKDILAKRAGNRCSICYKLTYGPSSTSNKYVSDGIAAHITAASKNGPRYDSRLTKEERCSINNGIWVCSKHGRDIDSDSFGYSVDTLRGLKKIAESKAAEEYNKQEYLKDKSISLIEFPYAETAFQLFSVVQPLNYDFQSTSALRDMFKATNNFNLFKHFTEVIESTWTSNPNVAGILATLLSNNLNEWNPAKLELEKLEQLCQEVIQEDDWTKIAMIEPLAFALSSKGRKEIHLKVIERLINKDKWRESDSKRVKKYYGGEGNELAAILRHWNDPFRKGLLKANDVGRLISLLISNDNILKSSNSGDYFIKLLHQHADLIKQHGSIQLASKINQFTDGIEKRMIEIIKKLQADNNV